MGTTLKIPKGFTLIEVIIAMFILTVALLSLVSVTIMVIKGNSFSRQMTTATTLARDKMEALKNKIYTDSDFTAGNHNDPGNPLEVIFTRTWNVNIDSPAANMKTITVTVTWNWGLIPRSVMLSTIIAS